MFLNRTVTICSLLLVSALLGAISVEGCPLAGEYHGYSELSIEGLVSVGGCGPCDGVGDSKKSRLCDIVDGELTESPCVPAKCGSLGSNPATILIEDVDDECHLTVVPPSNEEGEPVCLGGANGESTFYYDCTSSNPEIKKHKSTYSCDFMGGNILPPHLPVIEGYIEAKYNEKSGMLQWQLDGGSVGSIYAFKQD